MGRGLDAKVLEVNIIVSNGHTMALQHPQNLVSSYESDLGDAMRVSEGDTDLGWREAFTGEFDDVVDDIVRRRFEPSRRGSAVWQSRGGYIQSQPWMYSMKEEELRTNTLSRRVHTTHVERRVLVEKD